MLPKKNTRAIHRAPGSLHWLVDKKFSYPPVPSSASITPPHPFSPGQIHMHRGGQKDGRMDGYGEGGRERERDRDKDTEGEKEIEG